VLARPWSIDMRKLGIPHNTFVFVSDGRRCRPNSWLRT